MHLQSLICLAFIDALLVSALEVDKVRIGVAVPLARRFNLTDQDGVVNVTVLRNQQSKARSKVARGLRFFRMNTGSFHPNDMRRPAATRREAGAVNLTNDNGALWHGSILVGTPPKAFTVDFDTGSSDLFLPGESCNESCEGHTIYNTKESSTASDLSRNFSLSYADGSTVQGDQFSDVVAIAGLNATDQTLGAATVYSAGFGPDVFPPDGLMGMAFPQISAFRARPLFQTLIALNQTSLPQFGFKLGTNGSELFLGGNNSELYSGPITQIPVTQKGFWQVRLEGVSVGNDTTSEKLSAIIDTGTTLITGDPQEVAKLYAAIPGARDASDTVGPGFFTCEYLSRLEDQNPLMQQQPVPCSSSPDVSLTFGGKSFAISADTFNLGTVSRGSEDCVGGVAAFESNFWVIGDVFLQNVYTVFDVGNSSVGFATLT